MRVVAPWAPLLLVGLLACSADGTEPAPKGSANPPPTYASAFARMLDSTRRANDFPSLAGAIIRGDSTLELAAVGYRVAGEAPLVADGDRYHLGSVLKHQTAVLAAALVDDGHLSWTRGLAEYFPDDSLAMRPEYRRVTLRMLLSHASGLPRDPAPGTIPAGGRSARLSVMRSVTTLAPVAAAGSYSYSNAGYMVAGAIIERAMDRDFDQVMRERLWLPLGMTSAGWGAAGSAAIDEPFGHVVNANGVRTAVPPQSQGADNPAAYAPAGGAHMSIGDWARFTSALLRAQSGRDTPVLTSRSWTALTSGYTPTAGSDSYGYGLAVTTRSWGGGRVLSHDGTNTRNYAVVWIAPLRDVAFLLVTNQYSASVATQMDVAVGRLLQYWTSGR
ncbi:MAG: beta-lactamase family protein [Gemmatimonadaceae bacterium]|nr:beta-lactamase family protein [Gemmatimonadaceae bacterium]